MTMGKDDLPKRLIERVGQTVLTWPDYRLLRLASRCAGPGGVGSALAILAATIQAS